MEHNKTSNPAGQWLDKATRAICFGPDRREVRAELEEHLEDKALDFRRIFPGLTEEEAQERAAAEMGDPEEIGKELARIHKPWLGYLWRASQAALGLGLAGVLLTGYLAAAVDTAWDAALSSEEPMQGIPFRCREPVQVGRYTLWVEEAALRPVQGGGTAELVLSWRAVSPCFWEAPRSTLSQTWTAGDDLGTEYVSLWGRAWQDGAWEPYVSSLSLEGDFPGWSGEQSIYGVPWEARQVWVNLETGGAEPITLVLEREEKP